MRTCMCTFLVKKVFSCKYTIQITQASALLIRFGQKESKFRWCGKALNKLLKFKNPPI